ncbi:MAG: hypothetical protein K8H77_09405, partial [Cutibacterium acnes]|nr:hypothetical protein [Cutibacterium acnes]
FGTGALHTTRQIGSATLVGVMAFAMRFLLDNGLGGVRVGTTPLWVVLPLMLSLDIWYAISLRRTQRPPSILSTAIVLTAVFGVVCIPVISVVFPFLPLTPLNIVGMLVGTFVVSLGITWFGRYLGGLTSIEGTASAPAAAPQTAEPRSWTNALLYVAYLAFVIFFVVTATPPA